MSKRKYDDNYINYGFIALENRNDVVPQCVICMKTLANSSMKPSLLKRHLQTNHPDKEGKDPDYFARLGENLKKQRLDRTGRTYHITSEIVTASYEIALLVAQRKKSYTIAEDVIMPAAKILFKRVIGEESLSKLQNVSLSNDTIRRRIVEMSNDIAIQVYTEIKSSEFGFGIQVDESTDVTKCSQLLVYVRYAHDDKLKTELLLCEELLSTTRGEDVFQLIDDFFKENGLSWSSLVGCTSDGAPAMLGKNSGFQARVKAVAPSVTVVHCFIHRFALCAKVLPVKLKHCLTCIVKIVNYIKASALNSRLFKLICEDYGSQFLALLYHTEIRWLSVGNTTNRLFVLRDEVFTFFKDKSHEYQEFFEDSEFLLCMAYLSDIFTALNSFNLSLQGPEANIIDFTSKLQAFVRKIELWRSNVEKEQYGMFENVMTLEQKPNHDFGQQVSEHLLLLKNEIEKYFHEAHLPSFVRNPFRANPSDLPIGTGEQEEIIELQSDEGAKDIFEMDSLPSFWLKMKNSYKRLSAIAIPILLVFPSTWECEQGFSTFLTIKSKTRNRLSEPKHAYRCAVSTVLPRISKLVEEKQLHPSH